jgi:DNA-methyltransferase (dcm)
MLRTIELFAGIGAVRKALINDSIPHQTLAISEIDKFAIQSYNLLYGETTNLGDISKIDLQDIPEHDLLVYGFPCQDISVAGQQAGLEEGSGTRSSLLWNAVEIIRLRRPKYLIMENVKNLLGATHEKNFNKYLELLTSLGYNSSYKILNANHFGVPQNRERVICVSCYQDNPPVLDSGTMTTRTIRDICEPVVAEKYYMDKPFIPCAPTYNKKSGLIQVGTLEMKATDSIKRVYSKDGMCPTLTTMGGGHREPKILEDDGRVRKLTPLECWRLMGFTDEDFAKVSSLSNTQLYKQAGNSICVPVLNSVLKQLIKV